MTMFFFIFVIERGWRLGETAHLQPICPGVDYQSGRFSDPLSSLDTLRLQQCLKFKNIPGCPCFKSWATKPVNVVALINAWLPIEESHGVGA